jgi:hypothetical protein
METNPCTESGEALRGLPHYGWVNTTGKRSYWSFVIGHLSFENDDEPQIVANERTQNEGGSKNDKCQ